MRKLVLSLAVVAATLTGCNKDESAKAHDGLTADIAVVPSVKETIKKGKDVNRGTIPVYVKTINVKTTSVTGNGPETSDDFTLVDDNNGAGKFIIKDIPYGERNIVATTTSNNNEFREFRAKKLPEIYAVYKGQTITHINNVTRPVNIDMTTDNGRVIVKMQATQELLDKDLNVLVKFTDENDVVKAAVLDTDGKLMFAWQGADAVGGAKTTLNFQWFTRDGQLQSEETQDFVVVAGESKTFNVTLNQVKIENIDKTEVTFDFTEVKETEEDINLGGINSVVDLELLAGAKNVKVDPNTGIVTGDVEVRRDGGKYVAYLADTKTYPGELVGVKLSDINIEAVASMTLPTDYWYVSVYTDKYKGSANGKGRFSWIPKNGQTWQQFVVANNLEDAHFKRFWGEGTVTLKFGDTATKDDFSFEIRKFKITRK